jgi:prepilin-type N-terminal cleavage/methylation domain-containing protein
MKGEKGVTLLELMTALLVVALSVLALYQMFEYGSKIITEQYHRRRGLEMAQAQLERIKYFTAQEDSTPPKYAGTYSEVMVPAEEEESEGIMAEYTVTISYSPIHDPSHRPIFSTVGIEYKWKEYDGNEQKVMLKTNFNPQSQKQ